MVDKLKEEFLKVAELIRIDFSDQEIDENISSMKQVFNWVESIANIEVSNNDFSRCSVWDDEIVKMQGGKLRKDLVDDNNCMDSILSNAPNAEHGYFKVPKVLKS
ncbi:aspartyl-tRNA(Asn)/glutamyl-tRNA(Gln) amidotransferase subunit C [Candidatus Xenohaliotis californiensis]|uniref:Glutamyl-tRNA(Gln) amidotransferase subunit C n=1 Tax=Candidatus Xenohaliotis californiensis TaxID=84677 RepID=A0ABP0EX66_9RICK|nr:aspartyl-tRNA(Asn)/glutamyl-tRNA(Gln) amidotransferase subunit C [Candidatus Xenohaliotis californiensis]